MIKTGDRFVELSLRAFYPETPPLANFSALAVGLCNSSLNWMLRSDGLLSPVGEPSLCADAARAAPGAGDASPLPYYNTPVQLRLCGSAASATTQSWLTPPAPNGPVGAFWLQQIATAADEPLCLSRLPLGTGNVNGTLGMVPCSGAADAWQWFDGEAPAASASGGLALVGADPGLMCAVAAGRSTTAQATAAIALLAPLLAPGGSGVSAVLLECDWLLDFVELWKGQLDQPYPILSPDVEQWSRRSTYADFASLFHALVAAGSAAGIPRLRVGIFFVGWSSIYRTPVQGAWVCQEALPMFN